jgi:hypothetical protein
VGFPTSGKVLIAVIRMVADGLSRSSSDTTVPRSSMFNLCWGRDIVSKTEDVKSDSGDAIDNKTADQQQEREAAVWRELHERVEREKVELAKKLAKESMNDYQRMFDLMMSEYGIFWDRRIDDIGWAAYRAMEKIHEDRVDRLGALLWKDQRYEASRGIGYPNLTVGIIAAVGIAAIVTTLVTSFSNVRAAFREFLFRVSELIVTSADAATNPVGPSAAVILPVFVFGIYVLFAIAYIVSLWMMFKGDTPKSRSTALRVWEGLNAFFIGVLSGKVA